MSSGFVAGTLVHTDKGLIPIQNLQVGDLVWTKNKVTGEESLQPILKIYESKNQDIWQVEYCNFVNGEENGDNFYIYGGEQSLIWVLGDADGYEDTPTKWTKIIDDDMQTMSLIQVINGQQGFLSWTSPVFVTDIKDLGCAADSLEYQPEILIDFSDKKLVLYYIGSLIDREINECSGISEQGVIHLISTDICQYDNVPFQFDNMLFEKYPKVAKFVLGYYEGENCSKQYFQNEIFQLEVENNHNYFVGNLGVLVGDSTIQGTYE